MTLDPGLLKNLPNLDDVVREKHRRSFYAFFVDFWSEMEPLEPYTAAPHLKAICDHAQAVMEGRFYDLSVEIGPGYAKSLSLAVALVAWVWGPRKTPGMRFGYSTYESELTKRDSGKCLALIQSARYQRLYGHVFGLKKQREDWISNDKGGFRFATSVGGAATGHRFHVFVGDDLLNAIKAYSDSEREHMMGHLRAMATRGVDMRQYRRIIIGQRLHEEDAGGWARDRGFTVLSLPTEYDPSRHCKTPIFEDWRRERGELLFPARFGPSEVEKAKEDLGPYGYSSQHQQLPVPPDGGILKRDWFRLAARHEHKVGFTFISVDTAFTEKKQNDTSALTCWGVHKHGLLLLDAVSGRWEMPELLDEIKSFAKQWKPSEVLIEAKANGLSVIQTLERDPQFPFIIIPISPTLSKDARAHAAAPFVYRGHVSLPLAEPITDALLAQAEVFPAGKVRDLADSAIQAWLHADANYTFGTPPKLVYEGSSQQKSGGNKKRASVRDMYSDHDDE